MIRSGFIPPLTSSLVKPAVLPQPVVANSFVPPVSAPFVQNGFVQNGFVQNGFVSGPAVVSNTAAFVPPITAATAVQTPPLSQSIVHMTPQVVPANGVLGNPIQPTPPVVASVPATGGVIGPVHASTAVSTTPITTTLGADVPAATVATLANSQFVGATAPVNGAPQIVASRFEYIPIERSVVEMQQVKHFHQVPIQRTVVEYDNVETTEYIPHEKKFTDYQAIEYITEQIPYTFQESYIDYVPQEKIVQRVGFNQVERSVTHPVVQGTETQIVHPAVDAVQSVTPAVRQVPVEVPPQVQQQQAAVFRSPLTSSLVGAPAVVQPAVATTAFVPPPAVATASAFIQPTNAFVQTANAFVQPATTAFVQPAATTFGRPLTLSQQIVNPNFY